MQTTWLPEGIIDKIERLCRGFLWGAALGERKVSLVKWESVCRHKEEGGLGIRKLRQFNVSFGMKLGWMIFSQPDSLWVRLIRSKYLSREPGMPEQLRVMNGSWLWKYIGRAWSYLREGIRWSVLDGKVVRFWKDVWVGDCPLSNFISNTLNESELNRKVVEYSDGEGNWDMNTLSNLLPSNVLDLIAGTLAPDGRAGCDEPFWGLASSGSFTTKSAYRMQFELSPLINDKIWAFIWKLQVSQRVRCFLWLLLHNALLTNQQRVMRHLASTSCCDVCGGEEESWIHVMRDCIEALSAWRDLIPQTKKDVFFSMDPVVWLHSNIQDDSRYTGNVPWNVIFTVGCWMMWNWRNERIFQQKATWRKSMHIKIVATEQFRILEIVDQSQGVRLKDEVQIKWEPPEMESVKLNVDGAVNPLDGKAAVGGVIRDSTSRWIKGFMGNIGRCNVLTAELWALYCGLQLCWNLGVRRVQVETDNITVTKLINANHVVPSQFSALVKRIKRLKARQWSVLVFHVYREANMVADGLANLGLKLTCGGQVLNEAPEEIKRFLEDDARGKSYGRWVTA